MEVKRCSAVLLERDCEMRDMRKKMKNLKVGEADDLMMRSSCLYDHW
jgi:hypothetical protein